MDSEPATVLAPFSPVFDSMTQLLTLAAFVVLLSSIKGEVRRRWQQSWGARRAQARLLEQLCCGASRRFVDDLLGVPLFESRTVPDEWAGTDTAGVYRLPGAWVQIGFAEQTVVWFAITIRRPESRLDITRLTHGNLRLSLGRDTFAAIEHPCVRAGRRLGARRVGYSERHYFGNPGAYQTYVLSHEDSGTGAMCDAMIRHLNDSDAPHVAPESARASTTVNTLTIIGPAADPGERDFWAADHDLVRQAVR